eukprot:CAMPEP_0175084332 /NCGR_PEP_ID=MMETSP0052_2-20121109/27985_1 /TAXON_ID=51329 ORGANISM="Polytomella parva, Strain SAG 63-3" /NCGR_SAMPLE_ID=MMETSP0052_2 /ASSEMBLY_ACC=CAM_ASM_000194 /LENGTH=181 /DNA_ID=CAMNT_0016356093 /DNA_START=44 /DNA_END=586 /DNA_ORIENTATION=-
MRSLHFLSSSKPLEFAMAGWDVLTNHIYQEEKKKWRIEDNRWKDILGHKHESFHKQRELSTTLRTYTEDMKQLLNIRQLWSSHERRQIEDLDEAVENVRALAELSTMIAAFNIVAIFDFQFYAPFNTPMVMIFCFFTALTIGVELNACVACHLMIEAIQRTKYAFIGEEEEAEFVWRAKYW